MWLYFDFFKMILNYLILFIVVLISVAFMTLMEQKILASSQIRVGPNFVGYWGVLQPFSDACKLFSKEGLSLHSSNLVIYHLSPALSLGLVLVLWLVFPFFEGGLDLNYGLMFFICVSGLGVYPILSSGWASNCKYSMLGSLRAVAQMISYEVSLLMILLSVVWLSGSFSINVILSDQSMVYNGILLMPLCMIWFVSALAETNRTPYDFAEGESELVSGFNTEYSAGGFTLIFMAEYGSILFMGVLLSFLFLSGGANSWLVVFKGILVSFIFVWVRATLPRFRYDKLMSLAWKSFLFIVLALYVFYLFIGMLVWF
uniref:NADH-ubiquinone oxidoreductase chain 1 n=1 Tax=Jesogammarus hinumensis TaxID=378308 RepID=A0A891ZK20_9CRUS|nr:NADH dehydrogenase subunit 1 [Jesogammarus hinumensis]QRN71588.1 NADH dehydrogenase subunit 1 [Jesogammarus hinumensis]